MATAKRKLSSDEVGVALLEQMIGATARKGYREGLEPAPTEKPKEDELDLDALEAALKGG